MASLSQWSPYEDNVQGGMTDGRFMNAAYTVVCAGPPRLSQVGGPEFLGAALTGGSAAEDMLAYPIGVIQNFNLSHNMQLSRIFELGSVRSYFIPGRVMGQIGLGRVLYHGPSLLRVLYAYYTDIIPPTFVDPVFPNIATVDNLHDVIIPPGYENIFLNLASDLFTQPVGLLLMMKDSNEQTLGAGYFESCYIPNHSISTDAMGTLIQEQAGVQFERMVPVNTEVVGLITG
jgi:hypothetical protein